MFPSEEKFKVHSCPLNRIGACERPHCKFSHESDSKSSKRKHSDTSFRIPTASLPAPSSNYAVDPTVLAAYTPRCDYFSRGATPSYGPPPAEKRSKPEPGPPENPDVIEISDTELTPTKETQPKITSAKSMPKPPTFQPKKKEDDVQRPKMPAEYCAFVPMPIRMRYLNQFIDFCLQLNPSKAKAYQMALDVEQYCIKESKNRSEYLSAVIWRLRNFKDEIKNQASKSRQPSELQERTPDPEASADALKTKLLRGPSPPKKLLTGLRPITIDEKISYFVKNLTSKQRLCCRCNQVFRVNQYGEQVEREPCVFHWGRVYPTRGPQGWVSEYSCCSAAAESGGCTVLQAGHVFDANKWLDTEGFIETLPPVKPIPADLVDQARVKFDCFLSDLRVRNDATHEDVMEQCRLADQCDFPMRVFALDCEMIYTTLGAELARVTVVDSFCSVVLDKLVKPTGTLIDCNTRFSGIEPDQLDSADLFLTDVQLELLQLFDSECILVGHSLESDLTMLKLVHRKVVDTSLVFPHKMGPPKKRSLKNLAMDEIQMSIQNSMNGHDSKEDACATMLLAQHKASEIVRRDRRLNQSHNL